MPSVNCAYCSKPITEDTLEDLFSTIRYHNRFCTEPTTADQFLATLTLDPLEDHEEHAQLEYWRRKAQLWRRDNAKHHKTINALTELLWQSLRKQATLTKRLAEAEDLIGDLTPPF